MSSRLSMVMESWEVRVAMTTASANSSMRRRAMRKAWIFRLKMGLQVLMRRARQISCSRMVATTMKANHCRVEVVSPSLSLHSAATRSSSRYRHSGVLPGGTPG